jgi:hypothetical protein
LAVLLLVLLLLVLAGWTTRGLPGTAAMLPPLRGFDCDLALLLLSNVAVELLVWLVAAAAAGLVVAENIALRNCRVPAAALVVSPAPPHSNPACLMKLLVYAAPGAADL